MSKNKNNTPKYKDKKLNIKKDTSSEIAEKTNIQEDLVTINRLTNFIKNAFKNKNGIILSTTGIIQEGHSNYRQQQEKLCTTIEEFKSIIESILKEIQDFLEIMDMINSEEYSDIKFSISFNLSSDKEIGHILSTEEATFLEAIDRICNILVSIRSKLKEEKSDTITCCDLCKSRCFAKDKILNVTEIKREDADCKDSLVPIHTFFNNWWIKESDSTIFRKILTTLKILFSKDIDSSTIVDIFALENAMRIFKELKPKYYYRILNNSSAIPFYFTSLIPEALKEEFFK